MNNVPDLGRLAGQAAHAEAQQKAAIQGYIAATARELFCKNTPYGTVNEMDARQTARHSVQAARILTEEVFGIKFQENQ